MGTRRSRHRRVDRSAAQVLLDRAALKPNACEVILEADGGMLEDPKSPPGELKFARSIPLEKARRDVLLVYKMNGEDLPPSWSSVRAIMFRLVYDGVR